MGKIDSDRAATLTPREVIEDLRSRHRFVFEGIFSPFLGRTLCASGPIVFQDTKGFFLSYVTVGINDHGSIVSCEFIKPVSPEVAALKKGEHISVRGIVTNANKDIVVLTCCELLAPDSAS